MAQEFHYPSESASANPSVGVNGAPIPGSSTLVAGENPTGDQQPLQTDAAGNLLVAPAPGTTGDVNLVQVSGVAITLGQKLMAASLPVVLASDETVPISAVALPLPAGAATSANQTTEIASLASIDTHVTNIDTNTIHVDTDDVTITSSVLPTGAATSANQSTEIASLASIDGKLNSLGQKTMANSVPVVIASDQSAVAITAASLPLPAGAATAANQATEIASLSSINSTLTSRLSGAFVPTAYDEVDLTYVTVGNGIGQIQTAVYKLATVTVKTLTLTYDGSDRLSTVVAS